MYCRRKRSSVAATTKPTTRRCRKSTARTIRDRAMDRIKRTRYSLLSIYRESECPQDRGNAFPFSRRCAFLSAVALAAHHDADEESGSTEHGSIDAGAVSISLQRGRRPEPPQPRARPESALPCRSRRPLRAGRRPVHLTPSCYVLHFRYALRQDEHFYCQKGDCRTPFAVRAGATRTRSRCAPTTRWAPHRIPPLPPTFSPLSAPALLRRTVLVAREPATTAS